MKKIYNYFLFDLDRTLWDFDTNAKNNIRSLIGSYNLPIQDYHDFYSVYNDINHILWSSYERGEISKDTLRDERFYQSFLKFNINDRVLSEKFGIDYLNSMPNQTALMPNALNVLQSIKDRGCKMAIISNGFKEVQYKKLSNSGIDHFFESVIISEEVGAHKPSPVIFKKALESINGIKKEAIMIGDDFANDIEGAQVFGIDQFFYNYRNIKCDGGPTYESNNLIDLLSI